MIKFISSAQAGCTQGAVYKPFHTAHALEKLLPVFGEKVDPCSNDIRKFFLETTWKQLSTWLWRISVNYRLNTSVIWQPPSDKLWDVSSRSHRSGKALLTVSVLPDKTMLQISKLYLLSYVKCDLYTQLKILFKVTLSKSMLLFLGWMDKWSDLKKKWPKSRISKELQTN